MFILFPVTNSQDFHWNPESSPPKTPFTFISQPSLLISRFLHYFRPTKSHTAAQTTAMTPSHNRPPFLILPHFRRNPAGSELKQPAWLTAPKPYRKAPFYRPATKPPHLATRKPPTKPTRPSTTWNGRTDKSKSPPDLQNHLKNHPKPYNQTTASPPQRPHLPLNKHSIFTVLYLYWNVLDFGGFCDC